MNNICPNTDEVLMEIDKIMNKESNLEQIDTKIKDSLNDSSNKQFIQSERLITSHRKNIGRIIVLLKKSIRKILRWYINPIVEQQNNYNYNISKLLRLINIKLLEINNLNNKTKEIDALTEEMDKIKDKIAEIYDFKDRVTKDNSDMITQIQFRNERLRRIERQINKKLNRTEENKITVRDMIKTDNAENLDIDYFLFEQKYRGTIEDIKERQKKYIDIFKGQNNILDIGCGRGEFVELLTEENIDVTGIDINQDFVEYCKDRGLNVKYGDMFKYLEECEDNSIGGIYCSQVIEHLTPEQMLKFIRLASKKLSINSPFVLETINPQNLVAVANWFYMDVSHVRPVHPLTLEFILESEGFAKIRTLYLNKDESNSLPELKINDVKDSNLEEFNEKLNKINDLLFGAQDYAIICNKVYS